LAVVVQLQVGIVFGHEHLVIDIAVVVEGLQARKAIVLGAIILL